MKRTIIWIPLLFAMTAVLVRAQDSKETEPKLDLTQRYLLLATSKTSTMQNELNQAAAAGYRVLVASRTGGGELGVLLEKLAEPPELYEYLLLATQRTKTMQKELDLLFAFYYAPEDFAAAVEAISGGAIDWKLWVTGKVGIDGVAEAFEALSAPNDHVKILVEPWGEGRLE